MADMVRIRNDRVKICDTLGILSKDVLVQAGISKGRYYKKSNEWSFPISETSKLIHLLTTYDLENEWYEIFPDYKIFREILLKIP